MSPNTGLYAGAGVLGRSASAAGLAAVPASGHASFGRWLRRAAVEDRPWHAELWSSVPDPDARGLWVSSPGRCVGADPRPLFAVADATGSAAGDAAKLSGDALGLSVPPGATPPGTALRAPPLVAVARTSLVPPSFCSSAAGSLAWSPASVRAVGHARVAATPTRLGACSTPTLASFQVVKDLSAAYTAARLLAAPFPRIQNRKRSGHDVEICARKKSCVPFSSSGSRVGLPGRA